MYCPDCGEEFHAKKCKKCGFICSEGYAAEWQKSEKKYEEMRDTLYNKKYCYMCYLFFLVFVPVILKKSTDNIKYHRRRGIALFILEIIIIILGMLKGIGLIILIFGLTFCVFLIMSGVASVNDGNGKDLPVVSSMLEFWDNITKQKKK